MVPLQHFLPSVLQLCSMLHASASAPHKDEAPLGAAGQACSVLAVS